MIKRLFQTKTETITRAALILGAASFLSRIIGLLRDRIFAHLFGAGTTLDAYYAAFRIPDLVYNLLIVGALSAGFIPIFIATREKNKTRSWHLTNSIMTILGTILITLCIVLIILTPWLMHLIVPGFDGEVFETTVLLTRVMFLSPFLLGLSSVVSGVLQSLKCFLIYSLTPIFYNIGIIIGAIVFVPLFGTIGLAYGVILGALMHLLIQLPTLFSQGFRPKLIWDTKMKEVREIGRLMIPRTLGLAASQMNLVVITIIASTFAAGSLTIFNFANNLQYFPIGIIGYSFAIAAFPTLSTLAAKKQSEKMITHILSTVRQILYLMIPLSVLFLLLRIQMVRVVYGTGAFDWTATELTANTLAFFTLSLFAQALIPLLVRAFFAIQDTWTPFVIALISALANIILSLTLPDLFPKEYQILALAAAFSIAQILQLAMLWTTLRVKIGSLQELTLLPFIVKISLATLPMAMVTQLAKTPLSHIVDMTRFWGILLQGAVAGIAGILLYLLLTALLQIKETAIFFTAIKRKVGKFVPILPQEIREHEEL